MTKLQELLLNYETAHDLNHNDMIQLLNISASTYYRWLNGESVHIKKSKIDALSELLNIDVEEVLDENKRLKPIIGITKAGYNLEAMQEFDGYIELGKADAQNGDYFLRVEGDSMEGSHIYDGDLLFVQQCNMVKNGQIAIVMIGNESTVKKVYFHNDLMILEASNPKYPARVFSKEDIENLPVCIIGLVRFVRTDLV